MNLNLNKKYNYKTSLKRSNYHRKRIIDISQNVNALHAAGAFSSMEILDFIYFGLMKLKKKSSWIRLFYQKVIAVLLNM